MARRFVWVVLAALAAILAAVILVTIQDYRSNQAIGVLASTLPNTDTGETDLLKRLARGETIKVGDLDRVAAFVEGRNDCSDFRLITLLRAAYAHGDSFSPEVEARVRGLLLGFRYGMDEPGSSPMVYWSENHQILFAADEFLAGRRYPGETFSDGRSGARHQAAARERILFWLDQRWRFGFSEWNSHYYVEDVAALSNLIDFAGDTEIVQKAAIVLDLLLLDMASQSVNGEFVATSGRLYEHHKRDGKPGIRRIVRHAFVHPVAADDATGLEINFLLSGYATPPVLAAIARDTGEAVIQVSTGRDPAELAHDRALTTQERRIMAAWGMEAFTNPETISASLDYIRAHGLLSNPFLAAFRQLNYRALINSGALPLISRMLDLPTNGIMLGRADTYTFRTADYSMSTAQAYRPGEFGDQEHIFGMTFDPGVTLFVTHPAVGPGDPPPNGNSPTYWTGNGRLPLSCQDGSINLTLYRLPRDPGFGRDHLLEFTHLHAPLQKFDRVSIEGDRMFLQYGRALVAVTAISPLERAGDSEVIQRGRDTAWVTEASSTRRESFEAFSRRVRRSTASFDGRRLSYSAGARTYSAAFETGCAIDGVPLTHAYPRHQSKYGRIEREPAAVRLSFAGHALTLGFDPLIRRVDLN